MGQIRFRVYDRERISEAARAAVYMCGLEDIPWRSRTFWEADMLVVERLESESGRVHVPWRRDNGETVYAGTSTLIERPRPYVLEVELARGVLHAVRQQVTQWEPQEVEIPEEVARDLAEASQLFFRSAVLQHDLSRAGKAACTSLDIALGIADQLGALHSRCGLQLRRESSRPTNTLLGIDVGTETPRSEVAGELPGIFSLVSVPCSWRRLEAHEGTRDWSVPDAQLEWAGGAGMKVCCGPLLRMHGDGFPDWMYLWAGDFNNLLAFILDHVRSVVNRYRGRVHLWHVASRVNSGTALSLDEDEKLRMVASATQIIRQLDPRVPIIASFDRPWGEYLADSSCELAPIQFADALARADLGLVGIGLEIADGYWPEGSFRRHAIAQSRLLDQWSLLGLPLVLLLAAPSDSTPDPGAARPDAAAHAAAALGADLQAAQASWIEQIVPIALAKSFVQVIVWNQLEDAAPHELPHGGLYSHDGTPKPALGALRRIRADLL